MASYYRQCRQDGQVAVVVYPRVTSIPDETPLIDPGINGDRYRLGGAVWIPTQVLNFYEQLKNVSVP